MRKKGPNSQHKAAESTDAHDSAQGFGYFRVVNPKGLDGHVARGKVEPQMPAEICSELYDREIRGESLHGAGRAIFKILHKSYPDLTEERFFYLFSHLIDKPKRKQSGTQKRATSSRKAAHKADLENSSSEAREPRKRTFPSRLLVRINHYR